MSCKCRGQILETTARPTFWALLILTPFLHGCEERKPHWLPDSSGFVYAVRDRDAGSCEFLYYDVADRTERKIAECMSANPGTIGISPDGKRFAATRVRSTTVGTVANLLIYDLDGQLQYESRDLILSDPSSRSESERVVWSFTHWSSDGRHVLLGSRGAGEFGIFNIRSKSFTLLDNLRCLPMLTPPLVPDGSGFLAMKSDSVVFVDWDGWQHEMPNEVVDVVFDSPYPHDSWWDGTTMIVPYSEGMLLLDASQRKAIVEEHDEFARINREIQHKNNEPNGGFFVAYFNNGRSFLQIQEKRDGGDTSRFRVDLGSVAGGIKKTLVKDASSVYPPSASPNQEFIAFSFVSEGSRSPQIIVCDENGAYPTIDAGSGLTEFLVIVVGISVIGVIAFLVSRVIAMPSPHSNVMNRLEALRTSELFQTATMALRRGGTASGRAPSADSSHVSFVVSIAALLLVLLFGIAIAGLLRSSMSLEGGSTAGSGERGEERIDVTRGIEVSGAERAHRNPEASVAIPERDNAASGEQSPGGSNPPNISLDRELFFDLGDIVHILGRCEVAANGDTVYRAPESRFIAIRARQLSHARVEVEFNPVDFNSTFCMTLLTTRLFSESEADELVDFLGQGASGRKLTLSKCRVYCSDDTIGSNNIKLRFDAL